MQGSDATLPEIENDKAQLVAAGWFKESPNEQENEIFIENHDRYYIPDEGSDPIRIEKRLLRIKRRGVRNAYSKIPLNLMVERARAKGVMFKGDIDDDERIPDELHNINGVDIPSIIQNYIGQQSNYSSKAKHWHFNDKPWIKTLRNKYFHFSANMKKGYDPRYVGGRRFRRIYNG